MTEWIKCSDRMPEPREYVLVVSCSSRTVDVALWDGGRYWIPMSDPEDVTPVTFAGLTPETRHYCFTHWMPLPDPPEVQ